LLLSLLRLTQKRMERLQMGGLAQNNDSIAVVSINNSRLKHQAVLQHLCLCHQHISQGQAAARTA
jgi:hypothetical protein